MWKEHRTEEYQSIWIHKLWPPQEMMEGAGGRKKNKRFM
jgi:hypothetical protein